MNKARANDFAAKAEKRLKWSEKLTEEMLENGHIGNIEDVERIFFSILLFFDAIHQALVDCSKKLDLLGWCEQFNQVREQDPLLRYLWKARHCEAYDSLVKWRPSIKHIYFQILNPEKAKRIANPALMGQRSSMSRFICYAYEVQTEQELIEKMKKNPLPSVEAQKEAGIQIIQSLDSLRLEDLKISRGRKVEDVPAPSSHLGKALSPSAHQAVFQAIKFFRSKLDELKKKIYAA